MLDALVWALSNVRNSSQFPARPLYSLCMVLLTMGMIKVGLRRERVSFNN